MDNRYERDTTYGTSGVDGTELMGGTRAEPTDSDLGVEEIMAPSPSGTMRGGSSNYAAETSSYGPGAATYPGGNQEVQRRQTIDTPYAATPDYGSTAETARSQVQPTTVPSEQRAYASPPPPPRRAPQPERPVMPQPRVGGVEQHVDRVQGKKPGLLEQLRVSIVPVAFIGVGVGLLVNKRSAERREEEIRTTVRRPQGGNTGPAAPYGGQQASTTPRNDAPPRRGNS